MLFITADQVQQLLPFSKLIPALQAAFQEEFSVPLRHHHNYASAFSKKENTLLLMPAWQSGQYLGVKLIIVAPNNAAHELPAIQGTYTLFDAEKGIALAQIDARMLTVRRTAAASALASQFLSRTDSQTLLMVGTGALAPHLIAAHCAVRPIEKVMIWGRNFKKAAKVKSMLKSDFFNKNNTPQIITIPSPDLLKNLNKADIISCATLSETPLIFGKYLRSGQHIDLVGSYQPHTREADDETILKATIFVDTLEGATKETGDIVIPIKTGFLKKEDIQADLFDLCRKKHVGRSNLDEIALFKSVGHALEDLAAAKVVYGK